MTIIFYKHRYLICLGRNHKIKLQNLLYYNTNQTTINRIKYLHSLLCNWFLMTFSFTWFKTLIILFGIYHENDWLPHSSQTFLENVEGHFLNYDQLIKVKILQMVRVLKWPRYFLYCKRVGSPSLSSFVSNIKLISYQEKLCIKCRICK